MYYLMCKDMWVASFELVPSIAGQYNVVIRDKSDRNYWMIKSITNWLYSRSAVKHRRSVDSLLSLLDIHDLKGFIDFTKCLSLTDTFWVKDSSEALSWSVVNLYDNEFDEVMAHLAFDNGLYGRQFSTTVPELTTDGALEKCWVRYNNEIYLLKQGTSGFSNTGNEPYSEQYCSDILDVLNFSHVHYNVGRYHGQLVSSCKLMTSKSEMLIPISRCTESLNFLDIYKFIVSSGLLKSFSEYIIFDYLVVNDDRHANNIAVMIDSETLQITRMAPIFDNGCGLLPYGTASDFRTPETLNSYVNSKGPVLYDNFYNMAKELLTPEIRKEVSKMFTFTFNRKYNESLPEWRLRGLETMLQERARKLLKI